MTKEDLKALKANDFISVGGRIRRVIGVRGFNRNILIKTNNRTKKDKMINIVNRDSVEWLATLPTDSIDMVLTSPPYDNLRKYGGDIWTFEKFKGIAKQIARILKQGGVCIWVVGDSTANGSESGTSFKQALFFKEECGLNLYDTMIYAKNNPLPQNQNRYEQAFEYIFVFSKGVPKTFNGITEPCKQVGRPQQWGRTINVTEKTAKHFRVNDIRQTKESKLHKNIFFYNVGGVRTGHPAVFPLKLVTDQIQTWSNEGDIICDPFIGSGTTAIGCIKTRRKYIGCDINKGYYLNCCKRIKMETAQLTLF